MTSPDLIGPHRLAGRARAEPSARAPARRHGVSDLANAPSSCLAHPRKVDPDDDRPSARGHPARPALRPGHAGPNARLTAATLYVGRRLNLVPAVVPPAGPGGNGLIAFLHQDDIHIAHRTAPVAAPSSRDPASRRPRRGRPMGRDWPTGRRGSRGHGLMVVDGDGSNPVAIASEGIGGHRLDAGRLVP